MWQSLSCHIPPSDPNVEVVVSACRDPHLYSVSPDGEYLVYGAEGKSWLRNLVTNEEQPLPIKGRFWLSNWWLLQERNGQGVQKFGIFDIMDGTQLSLQWVSETSAKISHQENGELAFNEEILTWLQNAETVYFIPGTSLNIIVILATDFQSHPENNRILTISVTNDPNREAKAITDFLTEERIPYTEIRSEYHNYLTDPLPSHNERFIAAGTRITTPEGEPVVQTKELFGTIHGWAYDDSGIYYQLPRLRDGPILMPLFRVGQAQPILKLKVPETYLNASITASP